MLKRILSLFMVLCLMPAGFAGEAEEMLTGDIPAVYAEAAGGPESEMLLANECAHANTYISYEYDSLLPSTYTDVDETCHDRTGTARGLTICRDCGETIHTPEEWENDHTEAFEHEYVNGVCSLCGHAACTHQNVNLVCEFDPDTVSCSTLPDTDGGEEYHSVCGYGRKRQVCADCGQELSVYDWEDGLTDRQKHSFGADRVCTLCGYTLCAHAVTEETRNNVEIRGYEQADGQTHYQIIEFDLYIYCGDCGKLLEVRPEQTARESGPHSFDDHGSCEQCGYINPCPHLITKEVPQFDPDSEPTYIVVDELNHIETWRAIVSTVCVDCGTVVDVSDWQDYSHLIRHTYSSNDYRCYFCGHLTTCTHENTYTDYIPREVVVVTAIDDTYHSSNGECVVMQLCADCGMTTKFSGWKRGEGLIGKHLYKYNCCTLCGYVRGTRPYAPAIAVAATAKGYAGLSWNAVEGATGYKVYRQKSGSESWTLIKTTTNTSYTNTSGKGGTVYLYKVVAAGAKMDSVDSNTVSFTFPITSPVIAVAATAKGYAGIAWDAVEGAAGYRVYRQKSGSENWSLLKNTANTFYTNTSGKPGVTYLYRVTAYGASGDIDDKDSNTASFTFPLASPELAVAATAKGYAGLTWNAVEGAAGYRVYRRKEGGTTWTMLKTTKNTAYTNTSGKEGLTYLYKVAAFCDNEAAGISESNTVSYTFPSRTPAIAVAATAKGYAGLSWEAIAGATGYRVYRQKSGSETWTLLSTTTKTSYTNTSGRAGNTYSYKVAAVLGENEVGPDSNIVSFMFPCAAPVLSVSATAKGYAGLRWNAAEGVTGYRVYRLKDGSTNWTLLSTTTKTSYTNTSGKAGITYSYKVVAVAEDEAKNSKDSNVVIFTF